MSVRLKLQANCGCGTTFMLENPRNVVNFMKSVVGHSKNYHHSMEFTGIVLKPETKVLQAAPPLTVH